MGSARVPATRPVADPLLRARLVARLASRWDRRLLVVRAGAGFGKSTLVDQVVAEARRDPRPPGCDLLVRLGPEHPLDPVGAFDPVDVFEAGLRVALADRAGPGPVVVDELPALVGSPVALIVDGADHLETTGAGRALLGRLGAIGTSEVHVVVTSRRPLPSLAATALPPAAVDHLGDAELALTPDELRALGGDGTDQLWELTQGWPAAARAGARDGVAAALEHGRALLRSEPSYVRHVLAIGALLGGLDDELAAALGFDDLDLDALAARVPLLMPRADGGLAVARFWTRALRSEIDGPTRARVVAQAADLLAARNDHPRAFALCAAHRDWRAASRVLTACCQRGVADVPAPILQDWVDALPDDQRATAPGLLLRGLLARTRQPYGPAAVDLLRAAADAFRGEGDVAGEVAAASELAYVLRNQGRLPELLEVLARGEELRATGDPSVRAPAALARALLCEVVGDPRGVLDALGGIAPDLLSRPWRAAAAFLEANTHLTLGDAASSVDAATRCADESDGATTRHALALAEWYAGRPERALATVDEIVADASRSSIDAVALGALATLVHAGAGRIEEAAGALAIAERASTATAAGGPGPLMRGILTGARAFLAVAAGDDATARSELVEALDRTPVGDPFGWRMAARWLVPLWVLVPESRAAIEAGSTGVRHREHLAVARAVAAARDAGRVSDAQANALDPGTVATTTPLPWAMALAAAAPEPFGRTLVAALFEWHGERARDALRVIRDDPALGTRAGRLLAAVPRWPDAPVHLAILGPTELRHGPALHDDAGWQRERVRSLVAYLAVHGEATREQLVDALWPDLDADAAARNLRVTLTHVHRALEPGRATGEATSILRATGNRLALAGAPHVQTDAARFDDLLEIAERLDRAGLRREALDAYDAALDRWRGPCLADVRYDDWAQPFIQTHTDRFVAACIRSGDLHLADGRLDRARARARAALDADPWSEPAHRLLADAALVADDHAGATVALDRCEAMLAELGARPTEPTRALRERVATPTG